MAGIHPDAPLSASIRRFFPRLGGVGDRVRVKERLPEMASTEHRSEESVDRGSRTVLCAGSFRALPAPSAGASARFHRVYVRMISDRGMLIGDFQWVENLRPSHFARSFRGRSLRCYKQERGHLVSKNTEREYTTQDNSSETEVG